MKKLIQTILMLSLFSTSLFAQEVYLNKKMKTVPKEKAIYVKTITKESKNNYKNEVRFIKKNNIAEVYYTSDKKGKKKDGYFKSFFKGGSPRKEGFYDVGKRIGQWKEYYTNGQLKIEYTLVEGKDEINSLIDNYWSKEGEQTVTKGEGVVKEYYFKNHVLKIEGHVTKGMHQGEWIEYYKDGKVHFKEVFNKNNLVEGTNYTESGEVITYNRLKTHPIYKSGFEELWSEMKPIIDKRENFAGCDFGKIYFTCTITKDKEVKNVKLFNCDNQDLLKSVETALLRSQYNWNPATHRGEYVTDKMVIPVLLLK